MFPEPTLHAPIASHIEVLVILPHANPPIKCAIYPVPGLFENSTEMTGMSTRPSMCYTQGYIKKEGIYNITVSLSHPTNLEKNKSVVIEANLSKIYFNWL